MVGLTLAALWLLMRVGICIFVYRKCTRLCPYVRGLVLEFSPWLCVRYNSFCLGSVFRRSRAEDEASLVSRGQRSIDIVAEHR